MIKINIRPLPNARVPYDDAKDPALRQKVMLLNNNIASLSTQLTEAQKAVIELQKRKVVPTGIDDLERYVAQARASAEAAAQALADCGIAKDAAEQAVTDARTEKQGAIDAKDAAVSAKGDAEQAKTDAETARDAAVTAKNDAVTAKGEAQTAASQAGTARGDAVAAKDLAVAAKDIAIQKAQEAAAYATPIVQHYMGMDLAANAGRGTIYMEDFGLTNSSITYTVRAKFTNEASTARTVKLGALSGSLASGAGKTVVLTTSVAGGGSFAIDNIATSVNVVLCITRS